MKRLHVHVAVNDLTESVRFYSALFAAEPTVLKDDYAKWLLDDPRVNFAISARGRAAGLDHLGIQVEDKTELQEVYSRLQTAGGPVLAQGETVCCYARSEKSWINDPQGIAWETFYSLGAEPVYGDDSLTAASDAHAAACCAPSLPAAACCAPQTQTAAGKCC